jgi:alpha/beta superfamily hydrolase
MDEEPVSFPSGPLSLDGRLQRSSKKNAPATILLHPHPLYGGSMDNYMVTGTAETLQAKDWSTLRFNFRGTGRSGGVHGQGISEVEDVLAALEFVQEECRPTRVCLFGYSFGAFVGAQALGRTDGFARVAFLAPPTVWGTDYFQEPAAPTLILCGDRDMYCDAAYWEKKAAGWKGVTLQTLAGVDHFFSTGEGEAIDKIVEFLVDPAER